MTEPKTLLHQHQLRKTTFRIELLKLLGECSHALSIGEIKTRSKGKADKATIYRTLATFLECGLIHKVPEKDNVARYALYYPEDTEEGNVRQHAHFICQACDKTFCMREISVPAVCDTAGFQVNTCSLTLEGICMECS
ncbi:transcriptional repressor [Limibacter armeniacum]|uniref:Fur family transcriptional regulator n=1 Tax=Limibacter armeniacum TaxID=466084 RepID=UPI002FE5EFC6